MKVSAVLEEGRIYHIFLVGDWVDPARNGTDYDIILQGPAVFDTFTEATGYPEQVANDGRGQYFVAPASGIYEFSIQNDEGNSAGFPPNNALPAAFMVVEHIETDRPYLSQMRGRQLMGSSDPLEMTQVYEFTTSAEAFTVYVDTPEDIDMFEVRVYPMADGAAEGHVINGVPTPSGDLLNGTVSGAFGGFNTTVEGYRNPVYTATCVGMGQKMEVEVDGLGSGSPITYFLVLIAEYSKTSAPTDVPFCIRTIDTVLKPTFSEPVENVYAGEAKKVSATVDSEVDISRAWISYVINGVPSSVVTPLEGEDGTFEGFLPPFVAGDKVGYTLNFVDVIGNSGRMNSSFEVKKRGMLSCFLSDSSLVGGESVEITGYTTNLNSGVEIRLTCSSFTEKLAVKLNEAGSYAYTYTPKQAGSWSVQAVVDGDSTYHPVESTVTSFDLTPQVAQLSCSVISSEVKIGKPVEVVGSSSPPTVGLPVQVVASSGGEVITETIATSSDGSFTVDLPLAEGSWEIVAQVKGNWRWAASSSSIVPASVVPLTLLDQFFIALLAATGPPYVYVLLLGSGLGIALIVRAKSDFIAARAPEPLKRMLARFANPRAGKKQSEGAKGNYRRRSE